MRTATDVACAWCGAGLPPAAAPAHPVRCPACGVATTLPAPSAAELDRAYAGAYRPPEGRFSGFGDALLRRTRGALARRLDEIAPQGPVLDVGSGDGSLLAALRARGREAVGLERGDEEAEAGDLHFAAVVFWHSLEHLPAPAERLAAARERLLPGGVLVIAAPNFDSLQARAFGARWLALDLPRHLVHLTGRALRRRLRELGLTVERVSYLRGGQVVFGWLDGMVGALPGGPSLYDAVRRPQARFRPLGAGARLAALALAVLLLPAALLASAAEVALRRGGSVYLEARAPR